MINGYTRTCGLIGNPVEHTMSPAIHNYLAEKTGENLVYVPFHVPEGMAGKAVEGAFALNLLGCNVTVPYKSQVIPYLTELDGMAEKIGAVNTLVRTEAGFKGYNTDMPGLYRAFVSEGVSIEGEKVLLLGAGGVARAVAVMLLEKGAASVVLLNRTLEKAQSVADEVNRMAGRSFCQAMGLADYRKLPEGEQYLAIQATSVGMYPKEQETLIEESGFYERIHTGYDLIFNPLETRFMQLTKAHGGKAYNGLRMLLYQGVIAYELWTGKEISEETAEEAYAQMLQAMRAE